MKNQNNFDFKDLLTFGMFLLALLTFVFTLCKYVYIEKPPLKLWRVKGWFFYFYTGQPTLWAVVFLYL